jgi:hypothetical protein
VPQEDDDKDLPQSAAESDEAVSLHADEDEKPPLRRAPVDRNIIRSLYGDEAKVSEASEREDEIEEPKDPESETEPSKSTESDSPQPDSHISAPPPQGAIIGEVINAGVRTLGEKLNDASKSDMASKIAKQKTGDLRHAIGLNDKFVMLRDMFEGDEAAFDSAIARLEQFSDLDDAVIYIHDTYQWRGDSQGVKLLMELLIRKLS